MIQGDTELEFQFFVFFFSPHKIPYLSLSDWQRRLLQGGDPFPELSKITKSIEHIKEQGPGGQTAHTEAWR